MRAPRFFAVCQSSRTRMPRLPQHQAGSISRERAAGLGGLRSSSVPEHAASPSSSGRQMSAEPLFRPRRPVNLPRAYRTQRLAYAMALKRRHWNRSGKVRMLRTTSRHVRLPRWTLPALQKGAARDPGRARKELHIHPRRSGHHEAAPDNTPRRSGALPLVGAWHSVMLRARIISPVAIPAQSVRSSRREVG